MLLQRRIVSSPIARIALRGETTTVNKHPKPLRTKQRGVDVLHDPLWNKGMGFPIAERFINNAFCIFLQTNWFISCPVCCRDRLGLRGLLPPIVKSQESQLERALQHVRLSMYWLLFW